MDFDIINAVMVQFQRAGLIEGQNLRQSSLSFVLRVEAHNYAQKGGFFASVTSIEKGEFRRTQPHQV